MCKSPRQGEVIMQEQNVVPGVTPEAAANRLQISKDIAEAQALEAAYRVSDAGMFATEHVANYEAGAYFVKRTRQHAAT